MWADLRSLLKPKGNSKTIEVEAKYEGCVCTLNIPIRTVSMILKQVNQELSIEL
jgi:hypothetical protein